MKNIEPSKLMENDDIFSKLGIYTGVFEDYYEYRKNKGILKKLPMLISWMQNIGDKKKIGYDIMEFLEKKYQNLFPPYKIRSFHIEPDLEEVDQKADQIQKKPENLQELKKTFITSSYWRKKIKSDFTSKNESIFSIKSPILSFMNGLDRDIEIIKDFSWIPYITNNLAKSAFSLGIYFNIIMFSEIILLGNKGLYKKFLSSIKQMNRESLTSIFEIITITGINVIQRMQVFLDSNDQNVKDLLKLIKQIRKTCSKLLYDTIQTSRVEQNISPVEIQFFFMAGIIVCSNYNSINIKKYIHEQIFTPLSQISYCFGRVIYNSSNLEVSEFSTRSFLRLMILYRSAELHDWLLLLNNGLRVLIRKIGIDLIKEKRVVHETRTSSNISPSNPIIYLLNREQYFWSPKESQWLMINTLIKEFINLIQNRSSNPHLYEASTAFMMGFNYEQFYQKKNRSEKND